MRSLVVNVIFVEDMSKKIKILLWIVGVPTALLLLVMCLSPVVRLVVNNHGVDLIGREMRVKQVVINPFLGNVTLKDFQCKEANGITNFVAFDRLHVNINWLALAGKHVNLKHIYLDGLSGQILSDEKEFNFADLIQRFSRPDSIPQDTTPSQWTVSLKDIRLHNGRLLFHDLAKDNRWLVDSVNLNVPGLYFGRQQSNAGLTFNLPTGGTVTVSAEYIMALRRYALSLKLDEVNTNVALPLVQDYLKVSGLGALITGDIHIDGSLENVKDLVATGALSMTGLRIIDEDYDPIAGLDEVRVVIHRGDLATNSFLLDTLLIKGITGNFEKNAKYNTLSRLLQDKKEEPLPQNDSVEAQNNAIVEAPDTIIEVPTAPLTWATKYLLITAKNLSFEDNSMKRHFEYAIDTLTLYGTNIASQGRNQLNLTANLTNRAKLKASYTGGLDFATGKHTLNAKLTGVKIKDFSPYTEHLFACPIEKGDLAMQLTGDLLNGKLNSTANITIDQPEIGKKQRITKAKFKDVPLKLGVDMLKSAQGIVVLEVPVNGNINSPKFKLGKVIGRAVAKVFFGPLMGVKDNRKKISEDEAAEIMELMGEEDAN